MTKHLAVAIIALSATVAARAGTIGQQCVRENLGNASRDIAYTLTDPQGVKWQCARVYHDFSAGGGYVAMMLPADTSARVSQSFTNADDAVAWLAAQPFLSASAFGK